MNIKEFEKNIKKYNSIKINEFNELKRYLTNPKNYSHNFSPEEITEGYISNEDYYGAYVFDEAIIANRNIVPVHDSGWNSTVIFIKSYDKKNIENYYVHQSNGLTYEEMKKFLLDIKLLSEIRKN